MANSHFTLGLRSAKEKFLYFHDLTACNRICGARFFYALNSFRLSGLNLHFPSFFHYRDVLSRGVVTSGLLSRASERVLVLLDLQRYSPALDLWRGRYARLKSGSTVFAVNSFKTLISFSKQDNYLENYRRFAL